MPGFHTKAQFTKTRYEKMFNNGLLDINGGKAVSWWIGQDGQFWVTHYFRSTYQQITNPMGWEIKETAQ